ncbi:hypothetical protein P3H15_45945 [Rhodococcus sp. T2V]|uniref:hypothetical protein n=1 Tax=Rhodococcus sp. T2V TaxID=3034164 RepID=UPI0023E0F1F5|nr:hypothetical protein [Rhodococcus sp. T2V]MDF3312301.1 hypothetical protein [Rhodococcus sp. T2V]
MTTPDRDTAQARVFLDQLRAEIEILSERIEDAQARAQQARAVDRSLAARFRAEAEAEAAALRQQRREAQQLVDGLVVRCSPRCAASTTSRRADRPAESETRCGGWCVCHRLVHRPTPIGASR